MLKSFSSFMKNFKSLLPMYTSPGNIWEPEETLILIHVVGSYGSSPFDSNVSALNRKIDAVSRP